MGAYQIFKNALIRKIKCLLGDKPPSNTYKLNNLWYYSGFDIANGKDFTSYGRYIKDEEKING